MFQGGRHIDYVVDQIVTKLIEVVKKKNKAGVSVKPFQVTTQTISENLQLLFSSRRVFITTSCLYLR